MHRTTVSFERGMRTTAIAYEKGSRRSKNFKQILMRKSASFTFEINAALVGFFVFEEIETQMAKDIHVFSGKAGTHRVHPEYCVNLRNGVK